MFFDWLKQLLFPHKLGLVRVRANNTPSRR